MTNHDSNESIICPIIIVWLIFIFRLIFLFDRQYQNFRNKVTCIIYFLLAIFISVSVSDRNYCLYMTATIISLLLNLYDTIIFILIFPDLHIIFLETFGKLGFEENSKIWAFIIIIIVFAILLCWIDSCILCCYSSKVKKINNDNKNNNSANLGFQPLVELENK